MPRRGSSSESIVRRLGIYSAALAIVISVLFALQVGAQSSKGGSTSRPQTSNANSYSAPAPSPVAQLRQQQQASQSSFRPTNSPATGGQKKRPQQQQQTKYAQQDNEAPATATEDPLSDSEPALYGSVAGAPGVDFPAYTRIPKTSFTCEGKGFDFGFYADEEAQCQVYHVCWEGRRESFLCGVGTVFNQAILACDYWHSVDCSKSSQFYGINSELGKASSEPASGGSQRLQPTRTQATLPQAQSQAPSSSSSSLGASTGASSSPNAATNFGEPINQRRTSAQQQPIQQQQQYNSDDFEQPQQQQQQVQAPSYSSKSNERQQPASPASFAATFAPQRSQPSYDYQQRTIQDSPVKSAAPRAQPQPATTSAPPPPVKRPRFNMDFNQKVNSLIDSPVRPPLKTASTKQPPRQQPQPQPQRQQQQQQLPAATKQPNFAQQAVNRAQQTGSQSLNAGFARKNNYQQQPQRQEPQQQQQQQQTYDNELDEPQQQQQTFDDSPVQTSTAQTSYNGGRANQLPSFVPQQAIQTVRAGGSPDGSSSITSQYDTMTAVGPNSAANSEQNYESGQQQEEQLNSNPNDDFRASGAKAAASQNQNWYIMRSI